MTYQVKQAPHEASIIAASVKSGWPIPREIAEAPELLPTLELFWLCFFDLRRGLSAQHSIKWVDIQQWCAEYDVDRELTRMMHYATAVLDDMWRELHPPKPPATQVSGANGPVSRNRGD